jgi:hypothetical protein
MKGHMDGRPETKIETRFRAPGSLPAPGPLGRIIRIGAGGWLLMTLVTLLTNYRILFAGETVPSHWTFWVFVLIALQITPYVVNIGLGKNWRRKPQFFVVAMSGILLVVDFIVFGTAWAPPLGLFLGLWLMYFSGHLGLSFVVSALLSTPGCEMRSLPDLRSRLFGGASVEHYCPGPLDAIDRWERKRPGTHS